MADELVEDIRSIDSQKKGRYVLIITTHQLV
jgi:hypothetical protein